jgi:hypothetical protein
MLSCSPANAFVTARYEFQSYSEIQAVPGKPCDVRMFMACKACGEATSLDARNLKVSCTETL